MDLHLGVINHKETKEMISMNIRMVNTLRGRR